MNIKLITALSLLLLCVAACTTTPAARSTESASSVDTMTNLERYQAAVHANAKRQGIDVRWVNPPDDDDLDEYTDQPSAVSSATDTL